MAAIPIRRQDPNFHESDPGYWAERIYERHPKKKDLPLVQLWFVQKFQQHGEKAIAGFRKVDRVHALWCEAPEWTEKNARYCPSLALWLQDRGWTREPDHARQMKEDSW